MINLELCDIGAIDCQLNFEEDDYIEYLKDKKLPNTKENKFDFILDYCDFDIVFFDSETFHQVDYATWSYNEIEDFFGEKIAHAVLNECLDGKEHSFDLGLYQDAIDVDNPEAVNAEAVRVLKHGPYFKNCRGFILTNGIVVYTPNEHNMCTQINGIKGTYDFIDKGNIRVLQNSIDIAIKPTEKQYDILRDVVESYEGNVLYLDLMNKRIGGASIKYDYTDPDEVIWDIKNYFNRGLKPKRNLQFESKKNYRRFLAEDKRKLPNRLKAQINAQMREIAKDYYGKEYDQYNDRLNTKYQLSKSKTGDYRIKNDGQFDSGPFVLGNGKLSPDTLIINFMSAVSCPSATKCPISQLACYAVAGEIRLPNTRKKNVAVQDLWVKSYHRGDLSRMFDVAETYIKTLNAKKANGTNIYKTGVKYIRYNEAGDFPNSQFVQAAAAFSYKMKEKYGVLSMAYTSKADIDFSQPLQGTNIPIDHIIKINASRNGIKRSPDVVNQNFFAINMGYKELLQDNEKTEYITFENLDDLKYIAPVGDKNNPSVKSVPILQYGKWNGGSGYYYICPCSFMVRDKIRISVKYLLMSGLIDGYGVVDNPSESLINSISENFDENKCAILTQKLPAELKEKRKADIKKLKSPCGIKCAVCHDMQGGILPDGSLSNNYNVLTATHGATSSNYKNNYATEKREGNDTVEYTKTNRYGLLNKFRGVNDDKENTENSED